MYVAKYLHFTENIIHKDFYFLVFLEQEIHLLIN